MADYGFLAAAGAQAEADIQPPIFVPLGRGADAESVAAGVRRLHPRCRCDVVKDGLQVTLPPGVKTGVAPFDLRELCFVISNAKDVDELQIPGAWEHCCGNGPGCCANKG